MIYLFYGQNEYLRKKKLSIFLDAVLAKHPQTSVKRFYLDEEGQVEDLYDFLSSWTLFGSVKRAAVVRNSKDSFNLDIFKKILEFILDDKESVLILDENWDKKDIPEDILSLIKEEKIKSYYFEKLSSQESIKLILKEAKALKINIDLQAVNYLFLLSEGNIEVCINEIKKLSFLNKPISLEFLKSLDEYQFNWGIYDFSKIAFDGGIEQKLRFWEIMVYQKTDFYAILNYLAKAAKNLKQIEKIADLDVKIKSGLLEPQQAILAFLLF
jgi:DNA polymerase III delta subunit